VECVNARMENRAASASWGFLDDLPGDPCNPMEAQNQLEGQTHLLAKDGESGVSVKVLVEAELVSGVHDFEGRTEQKLTRKMQHETGSVAWAQGLSCCTDDGQVLGIEVGHEAEESSHAL